jgi:hypothetical protein
VTEEPEKNLRRRCNTGAFSSVVGVSNATDRPWKRVGGRSGRTMKTTKMMVRSAVLMVGVLAIVLVPAVALAGPQLSISHREPGPAHPDRGSGFR